MQVTEETRLHSVKGAVERSYTEGAQWMPLLRTSYEIGSHRILRSGILAAPG